MTFIVTECVTQNALKRQFVMFMKQALSDCSTEFISGRLNSTSQHRFEQSSVNSSVQSTGQQPD